MNDRGPGHPDPEIRRGPGLKKPPPFLAHRASVSSKSKEGGEKPGTLSPSPRSDTALLLSRGNFVTTNMSVQCDTTKVFSAGERNCPYAL